MHLQVCLGRCFLKHLTERSHDCGFHSVTGRGHELSNSEEGWAPAFFLRPVCERNMTSCFTLLKPRLHRHREPYPRAMSQTKLFPSSVDFSAPPSEPWRSNWCRQDSNLSWLLALKIRTDEASQRTVLSVLSDITADKAWVCSLGTHWCLVSWPIFSCCWNKN